MRALNPHLNSLLGSCLVEIGLLGWCYGKVFTESRESEPEHTQFSVDNFTWTKQCQTNPCLASRCASCATFPETHWKTDQTMTDMSPLFNCFSGWGRRHWRILIEIPVVDEWCPIHPALILLLSCPASPVCHGRIAAEEIPETQL